MVRCAQRVLDADALTTIDAAIDRIEADLLAELAAMLERDVDEQHTNPLSIFRAAAVELSAEVERAGGQAPPRDRFHEERFPGDLFAFAPAGWDDIDPELQPVGIAWGAWKAMTVLQRRRDEGLR